MEESLFQDVYFYNRSCIDFREPVLLALARIPAGAQVDSSG
jgi:hypothetical protein